MRTPGTTAATVFILVCVLSVMTVSAPSLAQDRPDLLVEGEDAKKLIVRIWDDATLGSGIIFHVDGQQVYGVTAKHVVRSRGE